MNATPQITVLKPLYDAFKFDFSLCDCALTALFKDVHADLPRYRKSYSKDKYKQFWLKAGEAFVEYSGSVRL